MILLFGGTSEGRELAAYMQRSGCPSCVYVATASGAQTLWDHGIREGEAFKIRVGRLDEPAMEKEFLNRHPLCVMDATHPYAAEVTKNLRRACEAAGVSYVRILRKSLPLGNSIRVRDAQEAAAYLAEHFPEGGVLLTTGSKELAAFSGYIGNCSRVYARILPGEENREKARAAGLEEGDILEGVGPFSREENMDVLKRFGIRCLVTKESGSRGGFLEKQQAAESLGVELLVITRPVEEEGISVEEAKGLFNSYQGIG